MGLPLPLLLVLAMAAEPTPCTPISSSAAGALARRLDAHAATPPKGTTPVDLTVVGGRTVFSRLSR